MNLKKPEKYGRKKHVLAMKMKEGHKNIFTTTFFHAQTKKTVLACISANFYFVCLKSNWS